MALIDFIKKQFIDVIEWTEDSDDVLAWRFPMADNEIQTGAQLTVRESQFAVFVNEGVVVDTHVARLSARFGLTKETDAVRIERALMPLFERETWAQLSHLMIWHGRRTCDARAPKCGECVLVDICPSANP